MRRHVPIPATPLAQLRQLEAWNATYGYGIPAAAFAAAEASAPRPSSRPEGGDLPSVVVLVPSLSGTGGPGSPEAVTGVVRTFSALWDRAVAGQRAGQVLLSPSVPKPLPNGLSFARDAPPEAALHWERVLFTYAHPGIAGTLGQTVTGTFFEDVCSRHRRAFPARSLGLAHAGVLAVAALHPSWFRALLLSKVDPYGWVDLWERYGPVEEVASGCSLHAWLPGYAVAQRPPHPGVSYVPRLAVEGGRCLSLDVRARNLLPVSAHGYVPPAGFVPVSVRLDGSRRQ